jgi:tRNA 2-thiouridine synthesizing protein A
MRRAGRRAALSRVQEKRMADIELDVRNLDCPLPILKTKKALNTMSSGQTLRVLATDPAAPLDFKAFASQTGHRLLEFKETDGVFSFLLQKA